MGVKITTKIDLLKDMEKNINALNGKKIQVGVMNGEHAWLAHIHEYGCNITAKRAQYLTIPCNKKAKGKKAGDFPDLFFLELDDGSKWLVRNVGKDKIEFMFALMKSVKIPERSFLRNGYDSCKDKVKAKTDKLLGDVINGKMSIDEFCETIGVMMSTQIKRYAKSVSPANSPLTTETKNSKRPLFDTGDMINSITYEVE